MTKLFLQLFFFPRGMLTSEPSCKDDLVFWSVKYSQRLIKSTKWLYPNKTVFLHELSFTYHGDRSIKFADLFPDDLSFSFCMIYRRPLA